MDAARGLPGKDRQPIGRYGASEQVALAAPLPAVEGKQAERVVTGIEADCATEGLRRGLRVRPLATLLRREGVTLCCR